MKTAKRAVPILLMLMLVGCGGHQVNTMPTSVEGRLAVYGRKVVGVAKLTLDAVDTISQARLANLPVQVAAGTMTVEAAATEERAIKAQAVAAIRVLRAVGVQAGQLVVVLQAIEVAGTDTERQKGLDAAAIILKAIQDLIAQGGVVIGDDTNKAVLGALMGQLAELLTQISLVIAEPTT